MRHLGDPVISLTRTLQDCESPKRDLIVGTVHVFPEQEDACNGIQQDRKAAPKCLDASGSLGTGTHQNALHPGTGRFPFNHEQVHTNLKIINFKFDVIVSCFMHHALRTTLKVHWYLLLRILTLTITNKPYLWINLAPEGMAQ
jgi:hypothetical protein